MSNQNCKSCVDSSKGRRTKNFMQCTEVEKNSEGIPLRTYKKCVPVLINDPNKYLFSSKEVPFRVQFPDEDSCKKAILLPGIGIECQTAKDRLEKTRQYQAGELDNCFNCVPNNYVSSTMENYDYDKKGTYLSLENCWKNQNTFDL